MTVIVTTTMLRNNLADVLQESREKKKVFLVERRGEVVSAIVDIDLFEELLALGDQDFLASIRKSRSEYKQGKVHSHEDVFGVL